jgi:hypothetical protein
MISKKKYNMYNSTYDFDNTLNVEALNNRLLTTFTNYDNVDNIVDDLVKKYNILYNKIFVLEITSNDEYAITYNIDQGNVSHIPENTILMHRKKHFNTLYTINALNLIIKELNGGYLDKSFQLEWNNYKNSILLTQQGELKILRTKIFRVFEL